MENQIKRMTYCFECGEKLGPVEDAEAEIISWHEENGPLKVNSWEFCSPHGAENNDGHMSLTLCQDDNPNDEYSRRISVAVIDLDLQKLVSLINHLVQFLPRNLVYSDGKKEEKDEDCYLSDEYYKKVNEKRMGVKQ